MLKERLPSFCLLLALAAGIMLIPEPYGPFFFLAVGALMVLQATRELSVMLGKINMPSDTAAAGLFNVLLFISGTLLFSSNASVNEFAVYPFAGLFLALMVLPWCTILRAKNSAEMMRPVAGTLATIVLMMPVMMLVVLYSLRVEACTATLFGLELACPALIYVVVVTKIGGDTFAYIIGSLSNKITHGRNHRIAPNVSPKKSWEGALGAMGMSMLIACLIGPALLGGSIGLHLILGAVFFWGGFFGDLAESALKRAAGVKDSGRMLPGTGGMWDVLDSLVFNVPVLTLLVMFRVIPF